MIGTSGAAVSFFVNVICASALGIGAGCVTCYAMRVPWGLKTALIDAVLAAVVAVFAAYVVSAIEVARGVWESRVTLVVAIAMGSVALRHLIPLALRSRSS